MLPVSLDCQFLVALSVFSKKKNINKIAHFADIIRLYVNKHIIIMKSNGLYINLKSI